MKVLKWFALISAFSVLFLKASLAFGFFFGIVKAFLSYTCIIGVSWPAVVDASDWVFTGWLMIFCYFIYQRFFK